MTQGRVFDVLLVEDDADDGVRIKKALARNQAPDTDRLRRPDGHGGAPRPDLILPDRNLPRKDGRGLLAETRSAPACKPTPGDIFTRSRSEEVILTSHALHANGSGVTAARWDDFSPIVHTIKAYWSKTVRIPQEYR